MRFVTFLMCVLSVSVLACSDSGKGPEEDELFDGKSDSFRSPTHHGDLPWDEKTVFQFSDDMGWFHAWDFALSEGESNVVLETKRANATIDTVIYLYKFNADSQTWGRYIAKNDDKSSRTGLSKIKKSLTGGTYRIIVKPYRKAGNAGKVAIEGTCSGEGCRAPVEGPTTCAGEAARILATVSQRGSYVDVNENAPSDSAEGKGLAPFLDYLEDMYGDEEDWGLEYSTMTNQFGKKLTFYAGEDSGKFIFDHDDNLLTYVIAYEGNLREAWSPCEGYSEVSGYGITTDDDCLQTVLSYYPLDSDYVELDEGGPVTPGSVGLDYVGLLLDALQGMVDYSTTADAQGEYDWILEYDSDSFVVNFAGDNGTTQTVAGLSYDFDQDIDELLFVYDGKDAEFVCR